MGEKKGIDIKKCKYKIVVDSREKVNKHILNGFEKGFEYKVSHHDMYRGKKSKIGDPVEYYIQEKGLKVGDYTIAVQLPNGEVINFQDKIVIERKADLKTDNMIDKILSSKHFRYDKASKVSPKSFQMMLLSLCNRYNVTVWYTDKKNSARLMHDLLYVYSREYLKNID